MPNAVMDEWFGIIGVRDNIRSYNVEYYMGQLLRFINSICKGFKDYRLLFEVYELGDIWFIIFRYYRSKEF